MQTDVRRIVFKPGLLQKKSPVIHNHCNISEIMAMSSTTIDNILYWKIFISVGRGGLYKSILD